MFKGEGLRRGDLKLSNEIKDSREFNKEKLQYSGKQQDLLDGFLDGLWSRPSHVQELAPVFIERVQSQEVVKAVREYEEYIKRVAVIVKEFGEIYTLVMPIPAPDSRLESLIELEDQSWYYDPSISRPTEQELYGSLFGYERRWKKNSPGDHLSSRFIEGVVSVSGEKNVPSLAFSKGSFNNVVDHLNSDEAQEMILSEMQKLQHLLDRKDDSSEIDGRDFAIARCLFVSIIDNLKKIPGVRLRGFVGGFFDINEDGSTSASFIVQTEKYIHSGGETSKVDWEFEYKISDHAFVQVSPVSDDPEKIALNMIAEFFERKIAE